MKSFKEYLAENYSRQSFSVGDNYDDLLEALNRDCREMAKVRSGGDVFYRGSSSAVPNKSQFYKITPGQSVRTPETPVLAEFLNITLKQHNQPTRTESLIFTTSYNDAGLYGTQTIVIPFDGAKVMAYKESDYWNIEVPFLGAEDFTAKEFDTYLQTLGITNAQTLKQFSDGLRNKSPNEVNKFQKVYETINDDYGLSPEGTSHWIKDFQKMTMLMIDKIYKDFKQFNVSSYANSGYGEAWTDSPCYILNQEMQYFLEITDDGKWKVR